MHNLTTLNITDLQMCASTRTCTSMLVMRQFS